MKTSELINWKLESCEGQFNHYSRSINVFSGLYFNSAANEGQKREMIQKKNPMYNVVFPNLLKSPRGMLGNLFYKYSSSSFVQENNPYAKETWYTDCIVTVSNRWSDA